MTNFLGKIGINTLDSDYKTPLHYACENNNKSVVDMLISQGSQLTDSDVLDNDGHTPLLVSVMKDETDIVRTLLKLETIDVNAALPLTDKTSLFIACEKWNTYIVELLLKQPKIDISIKDMILIFFTF